MARVPGRLDICLLYECLARPHGSCSTALISVLNTPQDGVYVARAPGRLDVMGGIADYSGALVLQLPLAEACHVAVQRHSSSQQRVWRHMQVRHVSCHVLTRVWSILKLPGAAWRNITRRTPRLLCSGAVG